MSAEIGVEIRKKVARLKELESSIAHTRGWWQVQLHKHRPDLHERIEEEQREVNALRGDLREIQATMQGIDI